MNFKEAVLTWIGWGAGAAEAPAALREAAGTTIDADEDQWRRLSDDTQRDLAPMTQERMIKTALYLWESNLLANRLIELPLAYLLAEGVKLVCADAENQTVLNRFWNDPINSMDLKLVTYVRELAIYGEQCFPAFVNEHNGAVRIGYLDPQLISQVVMDPDNPSQSIGVVTVKDKGGKRRKYRVIALGPEEIFTERTRAIRATFTDGECFLFQLNKLANGSRGRSDLLAQADWLDGYDALLFGEVDRAAFMRAFVWDVTIKGATPDEVEKRAKQISVPRPGSVRVHNDAEVWEAVSPTLQSHDSEGLARLLRNHMLGGGTIPEYWYGGGGDVNRSTAGEMGEPTFKMLTMRQRFLKHMLEMLGRFAVARASGKDIEAIDWEDPQWKVDAQFPEITARDTSKYAAALAQVVAAAGAAADRGLITEEKAVQIIAAIAERLGVEIDAKTELEAARIEAARRREADGYVAPPEDLAPAPADGGGTTAPGTAAA